MNHEPVSPLFPAESIQQLREALERDFSSAAVRAALGLAGEAALGRGDLTGVARLVEEPAPTNAWLRLFTLGLPVRPSEAAAALSPMALDDAAAIGLLEVTPGGVRSRLDVRPYSEADGPDWWVVSDLGADVRPGRLAGDHVLGIGSAATTLAQAAMRRPVERALDVGTGCGVQALHLSRHATAVTATDISGRALRVAATTAAINGLKWELRAGSFVEPVQGERYDLIVCNPPFIVGPGYTADSGGFTYRDSGLSGDAVSQHLIRALPSLLTEGGTVQLLANWMITGEQEWDERVAGWLAGSGCDAWVWQREVAELGQYVSLWLRDAGDTPGTDSWNRSYHEWLNWFAANGVLAVGMGLVNLRKTGAEPSMVVLEDVPQPLEQPVGQAITDWFARQDWLRRTGDAALLASSLAAQPNLIYDQRSVLPATVESGPSGWRVAYQQLRQAHGMRWEVETDAAVAGLVATCDGRTNLDGILSVIADLLELPRMELVTALLPVVRELIGKGFLMPS